MANTTEVMSRWVGMPLDALERQLAGPESASLEILFGAQELNELREIATSAPIMGKGSQRPNIVLLPGIMGSVLQSVEGLIELLWFNPLIFTRGHINLLELAEDGDTDAAPRVKIVPTGLEMIAYAKVILALRKQANLFLLPYDWRLDIRLSAGHLRAALSRWVAANGHRSFTLVGHSMGGIISRAYLAMFPEEAQRFVERVVLLGSPAYGLVDTVQTLATGNPLLQLGQRLNASNQGERLVRSLTALYQLLPPPRELFPAGRDYPCAFDLYDAAAWQKPGIRQNGLNRGKALHRLLAESLPPKMPIMQIAGYDVPTPVALRGTPGAMGPVIESHGPDSGDGHVPLWSATLEGAEMYYVRLSHDMLQRDRRVIQAVVNLANGDEAGLPQQLEPGLGPVAGTRLPIFNMEAEAKRLRAAIEQGSATGDDLQKLFLVR